MADLLDSYPCSCECHLTAAVTHCATCRPTFPDPLAPDYCDATGRNHRGAPICNAIEHHDNQHDGYADNRAAYIAGWTIAGHEPHLPLSPRVSDYYSTAGPDRTAFQAGWIARQKADADFARCDACGHGIDRDHDARAADAECTACRPGEPCYIAEPVHAHPEWMPAHDFTEHDVAGARGYCTICMAAILHRLDVQCRSEYGATFADRLTLLIDERDDQAREARRALFAINDYQVDCAGNAPSIFLRDWMPSALADYRPCRWSSADECNMARERAVAGTAQRPDRCDDHGDYRHGSY